MKQKFSDRIGVTRPNIVQFESMNLSLRNSIWNLLYREIFYGKTAFWTSKGQFIAERFLKTPRDEVPYTYRVPDWLKEVFYNKLFIWYHVYNLLEFVANHPDELLNRYGGYKSFVLEANGILEEEAAGYRFVSNVLTPITNPSEISSIEDAIGISDVANLFGTQEHLKTAIELLSKRPNPDYRNSIKESISSLESLVKQITGEETGGLDKALNKLDTKVKFHGAFKSGLLTRLLQHLDN